MSYHTTIHLDKRMNNRGISKDMVDFTLHYGKVQGDKYITTRKLISNFLTTANKKIKKLMILKKKYNQFPVVILIEKHLLYWQNMRKIAVKIMDKGGVTVVYESGTIITVYNTDSYSRY